MSEHLELVAIDALATGAVESCRERKGSIGVVVQFRVYSVSCGREFRMIVRQF